MRLLPLTLALLLAACAERWEKPGATEADSDAAQSACTAQAAEQIRPAMVWMQVQPAYWDSGETHCWTSPNGVTNCTRRPPRLRELPREVQARVLVVHGDADDIVPVAHSRALTEASLARLEVIPGGDHRLGAHATAPALAAWVSEVRAGWAEAGEGAA